MQTTTRFGFVGSPNRSARVKLRFDRLPDLSGAAVELVSHEFDLFDNALIVNPKIGGVEILDSGKSNKSSVAQELKKFHGAVAASTS